MASVDKADRDGDLQLAVRELEKGARACRYYAAEAERVLAAEHVTTAARESYDTYLKANRVESGIESYDLVLQLILGTELAPNGADVRDALENRVLNPDGTKVDIGPTPVETELPHLISTPTAKIALWGTDGLPNFDRVSGTRLSATSAWCMADQTNFQYKYSPDGLLYDATNGTYSAPTGGAPACLSKYVP